MMDVEQVRKAETAEEMRAEIFRLMRFDPMVRRVIDMADYRGMSAEDKYTMIAYYALSERNRFQKMALDFSALDINPILIPVSNLK